MKKCGEKTGRRCPVCGIRFTIFPRGKCRICWNRAQRERWHGDVVFRTKGRIRRMVNRFVNPAAEAMWKDESHRLDRKILMAESADGSVTREVMATLISMVACVYCGGELTDENRSVDHVVPLSRGGAHAASNLAACCVDCNVKKGDRLPEEFRIRSEGGTSDGVGCA